MTHAVIFNNVSEKMITFTQTALQASNWLGKNIIFISNKSFEIAQKIAVFAKPLFIQIGNFLIAHQETTATVLGVGVIGAALYLLFQQIFCQSHTPRES